MTTVSNPAYGFAFANAEALRQAAAERTADDALAASLRQAVSGSALTAGTTVTARYQFKVGADGSLVPLSTQITTSLVEVGEEDSGQGTRRNGKNAQRFTSFSDLQKPKVTVDPAAEGDLFAVVVPGAGQPSVLQTQYSLSPVQSIAPAVAEDESGAVVDAEIFAPVPEAAQTTKRSAPYAPRAQEAVAGLYARNYRIHYSIEPLSQISG